MGSPGLHFVARGITIVYMANKGYVKYLKSRHWIELRTRFWASIGGRQCQACGTRKAPLHVHHVTYERFGKELLTDLRGLCDTCHKKVHRAHRTKGGDLQFHTDRHIFLEKKKRQ